MRRIVQETQTPTGERGILIECTCRTHPVNKRRAIIRYTDDVHTDRIHGNVLAAWHPLAGAKSIQQRGPWRA